MKLFSGNANRTLSDRICRYLGVPLGALHLTRFSDGEVRCQIQENVRNANAFVIQPTCPPTDQNLMELLIMLDALKSREDFFVLCAQRSDKEICSLFSMSDSSDFLYEGEEGFNICFRV